MDRFKKIILWILEQEKSDEVFILVFLDYST